jgi:hypothetical protein
MLCCNLLRCDLVAPWRNINCCGMNRVTRRWVRGEGLPVKSISGDPSSQNHSNYDCLVTVTIIRIVQFHLKLQFFFVHCYIISQFQLWLFWMISLIVVTYDMRLVYSSTDKICYKYGGMFLSLASTTTIALSAHQNCVRYCTWFPLVETRFPLCRMQFLLMWINPQL